MVDLPLDVLLNANDEVKSLNLLSEGSHSEIVDSCRD